MGYSLSLSTCPITGERHHVVLERWRRGGWNRGSTPKVSEEFFSVKLCNSPFKNASITLRVQMERKEVAGEQRWWFGTMPVEHQRLHAE